MNLRDYKWFKNPRGLHNIGVFHPFRPERYIRPRSAVFEMGWEPPKDRLALGRRLVKEYGIKKKGLADCSICHR